MNEVFEQLRQFLQTQPDWVPLAAACFLTFLFFVLLIALLDRRGRRKREEDSDERRQALQKRIRARRGDRDVAPMPTKDCFALSESCMADIVILATTPVAGVLRVSGADGLRDQLSRVFLGRRRVKTTVRELRDGSYYVQVHIIARFGASLADVGAGVQLAIRDTLNRMTARDVSVVSVRFDAVEHAPPEQVIRELDKVS